MRGLLLMPTRGEGLHPYTTKPEEGARDAATVKVGEGPFMTLGIRPGTRQRRHSAEACHPCRACLRGRETHRIEFLSLYNERQDRTVLLRS